MIRPARPDEIALLEGVEESSARLFRGTPMEFALDHPPLDRARHERALAEGSLWVADEDGRIAGFLCAHRIDDQLYIDELAVAEPFQRRGLGRALMREAIDHARGRHAAIALITDRELAFNAPFYATLGFVEDEAPHPGVRAELDGEAGDGFDMARRCAMILRLG